MKFEIIFLINIDHKATNNKRFNAECKNAILQTIDKTQYESICYELNKALNKNFKALVISIQT